MNGLIFETLSGCRSVSSQFNVTVTTYWKHLSPFFFWFIVAFFFFHPVWRINIWINTSKSYFMTFIIQKMDWIKNKIPSSHGCFKAALIPWKKCPEKFINNFICNITKHKFYIVALCMHDTLFFNMFWRNKINCNF